MVRNLLAVDMTSNAVADKKSRLLFDADASATPMKQLASNHVPPASESSSYSDDVHSKSSEKSASGAAAVAFRYVVLSQMLRSLCTEKECLTYSMETTMANQYSVAHA